VDAVKSSINLISTHHFGGVAVRRDHLRVGFILDHAIDAGRITRVEQFGPHRFGHHIELRSPADLDAEVLAWLAEAQALQRRPQPGRCAPSGLGRRARSR